MWVRRSDISRCYTLSSKTERVLGLPQPWRQGKPLPEGSASQTQSAAAPGFA